LRVAMDMEVLKFGGSVLKDGGDFKRAADIVIEKLNEATLPLCVVSALNGVTDKIIDAVERAQKESAFDPPAFVERLYEEHLEALPSTGHAPSGLSDEFKRLERVLADIHSLGELSDSTYALAVSRGEGFSSRILSQHLRMRGVDTACFYGEDLLVTDDNYREAEVDLERSKEKTAAALTSCLEQGTVPIVAGFAGRSHEGKVTILGRGGSDYTAVCLAYALGIRRVVKYVDEDGVMTLDPKFLEELKPDVNRRLGELPPPEVIPYLSYVEASELLREERTKIVHYKVLTPLMKGSILLHIKNISKPESEGTVIGPENGPRRGRSRGRPKAISFQRDLYGIRFLPTQSRPPTEVYAEVFGALSREGVDVRYLSISGYQISLLMPRRDLDRALRVLRVLDVAMDVSLLKGRKGTFSVVGSGMRGVRGLFSRVTGVLARHGVNIEQATQPNSENIIRFSIDDEDIPVAVGALYSEFFT